MEVGEGLQRRWIPFVRSEHSTYVCDQLSKLADNSDACMGRSRRDNWRIAQRMNKSRIGFRGYSRDHAMQGLSKKITQECGSHAIFNDRVNSNVLTERSQD